MLAVHADRMDFVEVGQSVVLVGEITDLGDRRNIAIHRVDALERDELRRVWPRLPEQFLEMLQIIVAENALLACGALDPRDHRGVIERVREDDAAGKQLSKRRQRRFIRHVSRSEEQRAFLAVKLSEFGLK